MKRILSGLIAIVLIFSDMNMSVMAMTGQDTTTISAEPIMEVLDTQKENVSGTETVSSNDTVSENVIESGDENVSDNEPLPESDTVSGNDVAPGGETVSDNDIVPRDETVSENDVVKENGMYSITESFLVDTTAPYDGDYILIANTSVNTSTGYESTGIFPSVQYENSNKTLSMNCELSGDTLFDGLGEDVYAYDKYGRGLKDTSHYQDAPRKVEESENSLSENRAESETSISEYVVGTTRTMYLDISMEDDDVSLQNCVCVATGTYCTVWIPADDPIYMGTIGRMEGYMREIAAEFDRQYPQMIRMFGSKAKAEEYGDGDGKTAIICYDIDGDGADVDSYTGGYFYSADLWLPAGYYKTGTYMDCIHIDSYSAMNRDVAKKTLDVTNCYETLVHEFQHMINFSVCREKETNFYDVTTPVYLNEGFSEAASHLCYGSSAGYGRVYYYNQSANIALGRTSLLYWDHSNALHNYSLSYLFSQYIRTQYENGSTIYKDSMNELSSANTDLLAIIADKLGVEPEELLLNFRAALFLKNAEGKYGFAGEEWAENLYQISVNKEDATSTTLYPGSALVMPSTALYTPSGNGQNISFLGMYSDKTEDDIGVSVSGARDITSHRGQVQLSATVTPSVVSQDVIFTIPNDEDKKKATCTTDGLVTALGNGSVTVRATSVYAPSRYAEVTITISGQQNVEVSVQELAYEGGKRLIYSPTSPVNAKLFYTTDGSIPTEESEEVPLMGLEIEVAGTTVVKVLAIDPSDSINPSYLENIVTVGTTDAPQITTEEAAGQRTYQTVTLTGPAEASIFYTTDGSDPTVTSGIQYTAAFVLSDLGTHVIKAIAAEKGCASSQVVQSKAVVRDRFQTIVLSEELDLYTNVDSMPMQEELGVSYTPETANPDGLLWTSTDEEVAIVDDSGNVMAVGPGTCVITASADGISDSCVVTVHTMATDINITNTKLAITTNLGSLQMKPQTVPVNATNNQFTYTVEPSDREEDEKGLAFISETGLLVAAKNGVVKVTIENNDVKGVEDSAFSKSVYVTISKQKSYEKEYSPKFTQTTFSMNKLETEGKTFSIIPLYDYSLYEASIKADYEYADAFTLTKAEGDYDWTLTLTEWGESVLGNKSYKVPIIVETNDTFTQTVTVKISDKAPAVTLNKITVNPFYSNGEYELTAKSKVGNVTVLGIEDSTKVTGFTQNFEYNQYTKTITMARDYDSFVLDSKNKPVLEGAVILQVDGYEPQKLALKVTVKSKEPKLETAAKSYNMNYIKINDDMTMVVGIKNVISSKVKEDLNTISSVSLNTNGGKNYLKVKDWVEVDVDDDGVSISFTSDSVAAGTYTIPLLISSQDGDNPQKDFYNAKCNVKVVIKKENQLPKLTLKTKSLKLNKRLPGEIATIDMKSIDQTNAKLMDFVIEPAAAKSSSNVDEAVELRYNAYTNQLEAELTDSLPGCNKYVFNCIPVFEGINEDDETIIKPIAVTVSLINNTPTVSVSAKGSIDPINREGSEIRYTIKKSNFLDEVDFVEMIEPIKITTTILDGREYFEDPVLNDDGTISLKAKSDVIFTKKCKYAFRFEITMKNCNETVITKDITITPKQSSVKLTGSTKPLFYNKVNVTRNVVPITLSASKGNIARVEYVDSANSKIPDAFKVEIDSNGQLEAITFDGTQNVKKGTYTLTLNVYYEGQMWEAATSKAATYEKPVAYKLKVTVK